MSALIVALAVAALGFFANVVLDLWKRHRERCAIAAAIAGELGAYLDLIKVDETPNNLRKIAALDLDTRQKRLRALHHPPNGHPVFEKVADKIGVLDVQDATDISATYNVVSSVRLMLVNMTSESFSAAPDDFQKAMIEAVAATVEKYGARGKSLIDRLKTVSAEKFNWVQMSICLGIGGPLIVISGLLLWKIDLLTDETKSQNIQIHDLTERLSMIGDHQTAHTSSNNAK